MEASIAPESRPGNATDPSSDIWERFDTYPFSTDSEFKLGLATLLGQPASSITEERIKSNEPLVLRAKTFYFSRKFSISPNLDPQQYLAWRQTHPSSDESQQQQAQPTSTTTTTQAAAAPSSESHTIATEAESSTSAAPSSSTTSEPAYPASFAHIVELITTGQPIPGIEEIPDTVLAGQETPSIAPQRRKPWENEKVEEQERGDDTIDDSLVNGVAQGEQGAGAGRSE